MNRNAPLKFYEFFAGGGMARIGLGPSWECLFANDFDPAKAEVYRNNFGGEHFTEGDVWRIDPKNLPSRADLAWASSPCQDFSIAGSRAGLEGGRSSAFFGFWKLIEALNREGRAPNIIVVENVVGLLTSHGGRDLSALCRALSDEDYRFGAIVVDAARFVPQSRPRLFLIATKLAPPEFLTQVQPKLPFHSQRVQQAYNGLPEDLRSRWIWWNLPFPPASNAAVADVLSPDDTQEWWSKERVERLLAQVHPRSRVWLETARRREERVVGTVFRRMRTENGKKVQRAELRFDGLAGCLRTPRGGSSRQLVIVLEGGETRVRTLAGREAASLMGLDSTYKLPKSQHASLMVCGDGVVVPVVRWLAEKLLAPLAAELPISEWSSEVEKIQAAD